MLACNSEVRHFCRQKVHGRAENRSDDGIMQDEVEKRRDFEIEFLAGAYISKVAESDALKKQLALQVQGRRELVDEERQMVRDAERVWNESASERFFGKWLNCVERRILTQYKV